MINIYLIAIILQQACVLIIQEKTGQAVHLCKDSEIQFSPSVQCVKGKNNWICILTYIICLLGKEFYVFWEDQNKCI